MRLRPSCSWCKEWSAFVENPQLKIVVQCFKKLCDYLASSAFAQHLKNNQKTGADVLLTIIQEGCDMRDEYSVSNGESFSALLPDLPSKISGCPEPANNAVVSHPVTDNNTIRAIIKTEETAHTSSIPLAASEQESPTQESSQENSDRAKVTSTSDTLEDCVSSSDGNSIYATNSLHHELVTEGISDPKFGHVLTIDTKTLPGENGCAEDSEVEEQNSVDAVAHQHRGANSHHHNYSSSEPASSGPNSPNYDHSTRLYHNVSSEHDYNSSLTAIYSVSMTNDEAPKLKIRRTDRGSPGVASRAQLASPEKNPDLDTSPKTTERKNKLSRKKSKHRQKSKGCRCGLATPNPGKLTCCGQRCPCYSAFRGCLPECRCRGCKNTRNTDTSVVPDLSVVPTVIENNESESDDSVIIEVDV